MRPIGKHIGLPDLDVVDRRAVLCDLDGCLISGARVLPGANELLAGCGERLWIVSNNSADTAETLSVRLNAIGLEVPAERIVLAGEETIRHLARHHAGARVAIHADAPLRDLAESLGLESCGRDPDIVVLGRDARFGLPMLKTIAHQIFDGAELWVTNLDTTHPGADGMPVPETGALLAAVRACCGPVTAHCLGKPATDLVELALQRSGATADAAVFIGDNAATDGEAARAAGVEFIHIAHAFTGGPGEPVAAALGRRVSC
jgi:HAD superfamily hydrolase (TIGR01450 family)